MRKANVTILASIFIMALVAAGVGAGSMAYFSDPEESTGNKFTAGTLDIELYDKAGTLVSSPIWTFSNLKPGDVIYYAFIVENQGSLTVKDILQKLYITTDTEANGAADGELDKYLIAHGFWVCVVGTKAGAIDVIAGLPNPTIPGPDPGFNSYGYERLVTNLVSASQNIDIDITSDGNVPGGVLPKGQFLVYIYKWEFKDNSADQNDAQGDILELKMELLAKQP